MSEQPFYTSRREFLAGSLTFLSAAGTLPVFLGHASRALADAQPASGAKSDSHRILVVVQLAGGNDGINTVVPYEQDAYYKARRRIAIPAKDVLKLKDGVGLHPAAEGLKELYDDGNLAIVQGVGYPNPNRSHFSSMDIWQSADPTLRLHEGWLGRYFDACCKGEADPEPIQGVALMNEAPQALQGERFTPFSFESADALTWRAGRRDPAAQKAFEKLNNTDGDLPVSADDTSQFLQRAALKALVGAEEIRSASGATIRRGRRRGGGGELSRSLDMVARMIAADLPTRVYYVSLGGFDTHTNQDSRHRRLMQEFGDAMKGFIDDLQENNLLDRVLVMSFSEFGRRVEENAGGGTDHGEAAPMFLFGSKLRPGLHGGYPDLSKLHRGDLAFSCDFRRVYAAVLRDWLKIKPSLVLRGVSSPLRLFRL